MSRLTMNSSAASARSRRAPFGVLSAGLPAIVMSARTCPSPGVSISSARQAAGSSPVDLRCLAHAARPSPEADPLAPPWRAARVGAPARGLREHGAPDLVELPGEDVDDVDEPARERAELLRAGADTRVDGRAARAGELAREATDDLGVDPTARSDGLGSERASERLDLLDAGDVRRERPQPHQPLGEEGVHDAEEQARVG